MLAVANLSPETRNDTVELNLSELGLKSPVNAFDERYNRKITIDENRFSVKVKGRNYTIVSLSLDSRKK